MFWNLWNLRVTHFIEYKIRYNDWKKINSVIVKKSIKENIKKIKNYLPTKRLY